MDDLYQKLEWSMYFSHRGRDKLDMEFRESLQETWKWEPVKMKTENEGGFFPGPVILIILQHV